MKARTKKIMEYLNNRSKIIEVTKDSYTLENGDVFEHTFEISDDITVEEFQTLLDNANKVIKYIVANG